MSTPNKQNLSDIQEEILGIKKDLLNMKIKQKTRQQIKPHLFKKKKHKLAQLLTLKHKTQFKKN